MDNQNEKIITSITHKLKEGEIILSIDPIIMFNKGPQDYTLVITSSKLYFIEGTAIKKYFKAAIIDCIILTPFSKEMVINYDEAKTNPSSNKESVRIESAVNVKIVSNILYVRQKFCELEQKLIIMIEPSKSLQAAMYTKQSKTSKILGFMFKKKQNNQATRMSGQGELMSVKLKNFAIEIGQKMYNQVNKNTKLLYINSNHNFRFIEEDHSVEIMGSHKKIYRKVEVANEQSMLIKPRKSLKNIHQSKKKQSSQILMRKISKSNQEQNNHIARLLINYQNTEYKQELLYAIETADHFQILTTLTQNERNCQQILDEGEEISERDLKSIFFKMLEMIENNHTIYYSLCPENIIISEDGVKISEIFSCLQRYVQIDYMSPEQFSILVAIDAGRGERASDSRRSFLQTKISHIVGSEEIELINLWKTGVLMYELAYGNVPFPIEYLTDRVVNAKSEIQVSFPLHEYHTNEFRQFLSAILQLRPERRGYPVLADQIGQIQILDVNQASWKQQVRKLEWLRQK